MNFAFLFRFFRNGLQRYALFLYLQIFFNFFDNIFCEEGFFTLI